MSWWQGCGFEQHLSETGEEESARQNGEEERPGRGMCECPGLSGGRVVVEGRGAEAGRVRQVALKDA